MKKWLIPVLCAASISFQSNATELSESYLLGPWCLETIDFGKSTQEEHRNWVFEKEGKFLMQQSAYSNTLKHSGNWSIQDGKLQIKPVYMGGYKPVKIVSQDKFIFKWMGDLHVSRGSCR